jgi:hypothetical protein
MITIKVVVLAATAFAGAAGMFLPERQGPMQQAPDREQPQEVLRFCRVS